MDQRETGTNSVEFSDDMDFPVAVFRLGFYKVHCMDGEMSERMAYPRSELM